MTVQAAISSPNIGNRLHLFRHEWRGRRYLLSPLLDFLMVGGAPLLLLAFAYFTWDYDTSGNRSYAVGRDIILMAFLLSFVVNFPHFMMSYQLLYQGFFGKIRHFRNTPAVFWRYVNAGIIVPIVLFFWLGYAAYDVATTGKLLFSGVCVLVMMFFVGWHYMKQAFGVFMMLSALKSIFYTAWERRILLINSYVLWIGSFLYSWGGFSGYPLRTVFQETDQFIPLIYVRLPASIMYPVLGVLVLCFVISVAVFVRASVRQKKWPSVTAMIGFFSMYYMLALVSELPPIYLPLVPFFHSLQYMMFVFAYQEGKYLKEIQTMKEVKELGIDATQKLHPALRFFWFLVLALVLGKLAFYLIPSSLDSYLANNYSGLFPANYFYVLFAIFINIHHYFVDNVIWRKENREVGEYLLGKRPV